MSKLNGNVANADNGLKTTGVQTYVVTDLNDADREFWTSEPTLDVDYLGLQGNQGFGITFGDVKWGVSFLMEGDGAADWNGLPKAFGNPNESNIGSLTGMYFTPGADAVVEINNQGVALGVTSSGDPRPLAVDGITLDDAGSVTLNVADGNAIIGNVAANNATALTITGTADVATWIDGNSGAENWETIDASGVTGTAVIGIGAFDGMSFDPADFDGAGIAIDLSGAEATGVDAVLVAAEATLTLSADQVVAIGEANILSTNEADDPADDATLNVNDLSDQAIDFTAIGPDNPGAVTTADGETIVINEMTVFGNAIKAVDSLTIGIKSEDSSVQMTAAQFQQLEGAAPVVDATAPGVDAATGDDFEATLRLTDLAPDEQLDLTNVAVGVNQTIVVDGLVAEGDDPTTMDIEGMVIVRAAGRRDD